MEAGDLDTEISVLKNWAAAKPEIRRVWLFGSRVRGTDKNGRPCRIDSDLDIGIELMKMRRWFDEAADKNAERWTIELSPLLGHKLDVHNVNSDTDYLHKYISECSKLVFERQE